MSRGRRKINIIWFKRDLRLFDHAALCAAAADNIPLLPLYIAEPDYWALPDTSGRQWAFISESLIELRRALHKYGLPLMIRLGAAQSVFETLHQDFDIQAIYSHEETGNDWTFQRDKAVAKWCRNHKIPWRETWQNGVRRPQVSRDKWAHNWDARMKQDLRPIPPLPRSNLDIIDGHIPQAHELGLRPDPCPACQNGGRKAGLETLASFIDHRGRDYRRAMSSPLKGAISCSRLSPHIAYGTLSLREITQKIWHYQRQLKEQKNMGLNTGPWRGAMTAFNWRLHWHCHFMQKLEDGTPIEFKNLHPAYDNLRPAASASKDAQRKFDAWKTGHMGLPFADACMRSLIDCGWINFRMRAMLMSIASYHLWLDWRETGLHLARLFTDYEPGIHWPQVQMQSGTTGINTIRMYNPVKQGYDQDPDAVFIRKYVPEIAHLPDHQIHEPWRYDGSGTLIGTDYPRPIIDIKQAARRARDQVWAVRKAPDFRRQAQLIVNQHASRKRPLKNIRRNRRQTPQSGQMSFDL